MGKQNKPKKTESYGKGKVTPVQIAFIVDRYLSDNNFSQTRSTFRSEASDLISKSPLREAPKGLLTLAAILDEYIRLKEQKVMLDQEKCRLEHEKLRVQSLLKGMQDVMNVYNASGSAVTPPPPMLPSGAATPVAMAPHSQKEVPIGSSAGRPVHSTPMMIPARPSNTQMGPSISTPLTTLPAAKRRKGSKDNADAPMSAKRSCSHFPSNQLPVRGPVTLSRSSNAVNVQENAPPSSADQPSTHTNIHNESPVQGSSVAKCLFNQSNRSPTNFSVPKTPIRATSSQTDKSSSPPEMSSTATSANHIVISSETIRVSPAKQLTYYSIERNHCISSSPAKTNLKRLNKRDHVKGRLDFDGSDTPKNPDKPIADGISMPESDKGDSFDLDLPNLDNFCADFSLGDLFVDFDLDGDFLPQPDVDSSPNSDSGSPPEQLNVDHFCANHVYSELSSTVTEILSEKDVNLQGTESVTSVKSTTKCIKILSPVKKW
ncbi:hypothetical protein NMG60_11000277 [Bertholletia excelsa]